MSIKDLTMKNFIADQTKKQLEYYSDISLLSKVTIPAITVSMEPGSGGHLIASKLAKRLNIKLYDKSILVPIANMSDVDLSTLEGIEKERPTGAQDFIKTLINSNYIFKGDYLRNLKEMVLLIGKLRNCIIVGRGANFILPAKGKFCIRVIAPMDIRVKNVSFRFGVSLSEAKKRIKHRERKRKAFVRESFLKDIADVSHYDLLINTARMDLDAAVETAIGAIIGSQPHRAFEKEYSYILQNNRKIIS